MMTLDDAVALVLYAFEHGRNGDIFVQKAPAATVRVLVDALLSLMKRPGHEVREIGTRHGEKLYEVEDATFTEAGKVGLWTKADSVTYFDDLEVKTK